MATQLQIRRGTTAQTNSFSGAAGELSVNTSTDTVHVHDGATAGGHALAKADGSNIATYAGSFTTLAASGAATFSSTLAVTGNLTVDTNTLVVDAANNRVGIGISSPTEMLEIFNASSPAIQLNDGGDFKSIFRLAGNDLEIRGSSGSLEFYNGSADGDSSALRMSINAAGTVTASPSGGVVTLGASGHITSKQSLDVATAGGRFVGSSNRGILGQIRIEQIATNANGGYLDFDTCANGSTSPTRRMRLIDTKLLLGKTSQDLNTSGISINGDGYIQVTESASPTLYLNRLTSEGSIINFYKSGTLVGEVSTLGNRLSVGTGDAALFFNDQANQIQPWNVTSNTPTNGACDLGASDRRFRSGYFSGQVFANVIGRSDDTNTTIDFPGSDVIQMFTNGSERMRVVNQGLRIGGGSTAYTGAQFEVASVSNDDRHVRSISSGSNSSISGSSQRSMMVEGVVAVNTVSAGTLLTIPHFSQNGLWRPMMVELMFVTGEYNRTIGSTGGWAKFGYSVLTQVNGLATMGSGGNVAGVSASGNNIIVTFGAGYTAGLANYEGVCMYYKVMSITPDYFQGWNATLN